jgi:iron complex outermembrane recepter protein
MNPWAIGTAACLGFVTVNAAFAQGAPEKLETVVIVAPAGGGIDPDKVPANVQTASSEQIERLQPLDLTEFLNRQFSSVNINHAQNNPLQPDVNFRGFTASPLLGLAPGLTVYQNGVRINEPFGDTVNWDLIPVSAIGSVQLLAGSNPVFGLNTLGGSLSVKMKNGFSYEDTGAEVYAGSFGRRGASLQSGGNNGTWGWYGNVDYFEEDGWRDFSASDALRFYGALSWRSGENSFDLGFALADTKLRGNGPAPVELLDQDRSAVFTHPDITDNTLTQVTFEASRRVSDRVRLSGNVYLRDIDTASFNGDGTPFEECAFGDDELLVEEFEDENGDDECNADDDDDIVPVLGEDGEPLAAELDEVELDAINNTGGRDQKAYGASFQVALDTSASNSLIVGAYFGRGETDFASKVEVASLLEDRATSRTGLFAPGLATTVTSEVATASLYFSNLWSVSDRTAITISGRYDDTTIDLEDPTGANPLLDGRHGFSRFNPAAGVTFKLRDNLTLYGSYGESARAPTPVELECASEEAPCSLPNAFLADPPLEQVVARSFEAGARGQSGNGIRWHIGAFRTANDDDILFQTTGGAQANVGFFDNVGDTLRAGLELSLTQQLGALTWSFEYSLVDATFEDGFFANSPNHPRLEEEDEGELEVAAGARIPGIPEHDANIGLDYAFTDRFSLGADLTIRSGVHLRGDEANLLDETDAYAVLNLRGLFRVSKSVAVFARVENALDTDYETFGLLGEPDEVFPDFEDPRFLGAGPSFGAWLGVKINIR